MSNLIGRKWTVVRVGVGVWGGVVGGVFAADGGEALDFGVEGVRIGGEYVAEWSGVVSGGVSRRGSFRNMLTIDAELDLGELVGIEGGAVFAQYMSVNPERGGSEDAGDLQVYSNLENDYHMDVVYELWYEQVVFDGDLRIKVGKVDANTEFAIVESAGDFSNSSAGFSPTIFTLPTYPDPATSLNVFARLIEEAEGVAVTIGYGFYDGAAGADGVRTGNRGPATFFSDDRSDDWFHVVQAEAVWGTEESARGRMSVGGWHHTGEFERFDGGREGGTVGLFVAAEQAVSDGVTVFGQYGWAEEGVSEFGHHFGAGVVAGGLFPGRGADSAGVYLSYADLSDRDGAGFDEDEFVVDAYYRFAVGGNAYVQPEVQYVAGASGGSEDAVVIGVRVGIGF